MDKGGRKEGRMGQKFGWGKLREDLETYDLICRLDLGAAGDGPIEKILDLSCALPNASRWN